MWKSNKHACFQKSFTQSSCYKSLLRLFWKLMGYIVPQICDQQLLAKGLEYHSSLDICGITWRVLEREYLDDLIKIQPLH